MIVCPECEYELLEKPSLTWVCSCGAEFYNIGGIWMFAEGYEATFEDHTSEALEELSKNASSHFWLLERKRLVVTAIRRYLKPGENFLDVGVGPCDIAAGLREYEIDVVLSDIQREGLECGARLGFRDLFQFDLQKPIFVDHFKGVGVFDVLEHLDDDGSAVAGLLQMIVPGGYIFATVPAFSSLWNNRDNLERHKRRYNKSQLENLFHDQGAEVVSCRYIFFSIYPLLVLRALHSKIFPQTKFLSEDYQSQFKINRFVNASLGKLLRIEEKWFSKNGPPFGGSLLIVAKK